MADLKALAEQFVSLTLKEAKELSDILESEYGIKPAAGGAVVVAAPTGGGGEEAEEKTTFDVILESAGDQKIKVIKVVREIAGLGLKEAKELVDSAPKPVLTGKSKDECEDAKSKLAEAGATVAIK